MIVLVVVVFGFLIVEAMRAARNERAQFDRGGVEPPGDVYRAMRIAYPSAFMAMCIEGLVRGLPSRSFLVAGAVLFTLAKLLKWWAMLSLGDAWTFRIVVVPGAERVTAGPYRVLRHPNYVGVLGELLSVALMAGARLTGPIATVVFGTLMLKRVAVENRALDAILRR